MENIVEFDNGNTPAFESSQQMEGQTRSYETRSADCNGILIKSKGEGIANSAVRGAGQLDLLLWEQQREKGTARTKAGLGLGCVKGQQKACGHVQLLKFPDYKKLRKCQNKFMKIVIYFECLHLTKP